MKRNLLLRTLSNKNPDNNLKTPDKSSPVASITAKANTGKPINLTVSIGIKDIPIVVDIAKSKLTNNKFFILVCLN
jgi:hypothetical protein